MLDLTGQRFGRLIALSRNYEKQRQVKNATTFWNCKCDCGNHTVVATQSLRRGLTTSCGCYQRERSSKAMAKAKIKKCRYNGCQHEAMIINVETDDYHLESCRYYHADCWAAKQKEEQEEIQQKEEERKKRIQKKDRDEKTKNDLKLIENIWIEHISRTVTYSLLRKVLNELLDRGIDSDYLVFTLQYCVSHKMKLNYPAGLTYYVDRQEIKDAYAQKQRRKLAAEVASFIPAQMEDEEPKIAMKPKSSGFSKILGGG